MPDEPVISVQNVGKAYQIWEAPSVRLSSPLWAGLAGLLPPQSSPARWLRNRAAAGHRDFHALQAVSFEVRRGESVGIIGRNGSGKSTLLQIIAGTLRPTTGTVRVKGRVAALLELGSGFNLEFTGRENVFLNGAVLGFSRSEMEARFDHIAAFADIGEFIEQPVKTYSSGMMMRLAFAVQAAADPEVLIVDEALAVGDAQFVAKCINYIADFIRKGGTLLFVSHEVGVVKQLTTRALYLEHGLQIACGPTAETVLAYTNALAIPAAAHRADPDHFASDNAPYAIASVTLAALNRTGPIQTLAPGDSARMIVGLAVARPATARLVFSIYNYMGLIVCSTEVDLPAIPADKKSLQVIFSLPRVRLASGSYRVNFAVRTGMEIFAWARNALHFTVTGATTETFIYREDIETSFAFTDRP